MSTLLPPLLLCTLCLVACQRERAEAPLLPAWSTSKIQSQLEGLTAPTAPLQARILPAADATRACDLHIEEVFGQTSRHVPRLRFQLGARWSGHLTAAAGGGLDYATSTCEASSTPQVPELADKVCAAPGAGRADQGLRAVLARLPGEPMAPGEDWPIELPDVAIGQGRFAMKASARYLGERAVEGAHHPVLSLTLSGEGTLKARDDDRFHGELTGALSGLAVVELAPGGAGLTRLEAVSDIDWRGEVLDVDGAEVDQIRQLQSFRTVMSCK
jgi:hypothetical protein